MPKPSLRILESLSVALEQVQNSPDLTSDEAEWLRAYASRLIYEASVRNSAPNFPAPSAPTVV